MGIVLFSKPQKLRTIRNPKISLHSEHEFARTRRVKAINILSWKELRLGIEKALEEDEPVSHTPIQTKRARETERDCLCLWKWGVIPICIYSGGFDFVIFEVDPGRQTCWVILSRGLFNVRLGLWVLLCCGSMTWLCNWAVHFSVFAVLTFSVADDGRLPRFLNAVKFQSFCNHSCYNNIFVKISE